MQVKEVIKSDFVTSVLTYHKEEDESTHTWILLTTIHSKKKVRVPASLESYYKTRKDVINIEKI